MGPREYSRNTGSSWQSRQKDSLKFWLSVDVGRSAARAYQRFQPKGQWQAHEAANKILENHREKHWDDDFGNLARQEFDYVLNLLAKSKESDVDIIS